MPYRLRYKYRCVEPTCQGHEQSIIDWKLGQAWLGWTQYDEKQRIEMVRRKWMDELCGANRDTSFFVSSMHAHPKSFLVLGVFWPPRETAATPEQTSLDLG